jgi:hypothetical protein
MERLAPDSVGPQEDTEGPVQDVVPFELMPKVAPSPEPGLALLERWTPFVSALGPERTERGALLLAAVRARRGQPGSEADAVVLRKILEVTARTDVLDDEGHSLRAEAAATLLAFGYPWAFQLSPEELGFLRQFEARWSPERLATRFGLSVSLLHLLTLGLSGVALITGDELTPLYTLPALLAGLVGLGVSTGALLTMPERYPRPEGGGRRAARVLSQLLAPALAGVMAGAQFSRAGFSPSWLLAIPVVLLVLALTTALATAPERPKDEAPATVK